MYRALKWLPAAVLAIHLSAKIYWSEQSFLLDVAIYNLIWILAVGAIAQGPLVNDPIALACASLAISFWGIGSVLNSYGNFYSVSERTELLAQICYTLFYPFILLALPRIVKRGRKLNPIELLDASIFGLGISSIATALVFSWVFPNSIASATDQFFSLLFPIGDLLLLTISAVALITHRLHVRALHLFLGLSVFSFSDLFFLWLAIRDQYQFGQLTDDGWLLGIILIQLAFWSPPARDGREITIHPVFITISVFISPILLALSAIRPGIFPIISVAPTIATLFLAFIRMTIVIRQARNLGEEKVLARTDELTGLPNRRRLVAELDTFSKSEGALLLLDLNQFKPVNDQYGHECGNILLQQVAQRFSRSLPTGAVLARLGGDEFGVLINGSYEETLEAAYALEATLSYPFTIEGNSIKIGVSIGHFQNDGSHNPLERADAAMYEAKRTGVGVFRAQPVS